MTTANFTTVQQNINEIADRWKTERTDRQSRTALHRADIDELAAAGFTLTGVPTTHGGLWESIETSTRPVCDLLYTLARGDSSVALVASMHPGVLAVIGWLVKPEIDPQRQAAWTEQREWAFETAKAGHFWGTITSEPGSSGDVSKTSSRARPAGNLDEKYLMTGLKHFGSGTGMTSYMITTAVTEGEDSVESFYMDLRDVPMDGSGGVKMIAPWEGHGMIATQSHALSFTDFPVTRSAWPNASDQIRPLATAPVRCMFTAVIAGIVEEAVSTARAQLAKKHDRLSPFEQIEWSRVEIEAWQVRKLYEAMLNGMDDPDTRARQVLLGKTAIAELSENLLTRLSRVVGGSSFSLRTPYGYWAQDVRALGFLRPPWGLAFDEINRTTWE